MFTLSFVLSSDVHLHIPSFRHRVLTQSVQNIRFWHRLCQKPVLFGRFFTQLKICINFQSTNLGRSNYVLVYNKSMTVIFIGCPVQRHLWRLLISFPDRASFSSTKTISNWDGGGATRHAHLFNQPSFFLSTIFPEIFQQICLFTFLDSANIRLI